jgi:hypothetical protein
MRAQRAATAARARHGAGGGAPRGPALPAGVEVAGQGASKRTSLARAFRAVKPSAQRQADTNATIAMGFEED